PLPLSHRVMLMDLFFYQTADAAAAASIPPVFPHASDAWVKVQLHPPSPCDSASNAASVTPHPPRGEGPGG
ncbi:unnamed protein product, partial [Lampetra fluviatilis]